MSWFVFIVAPAPKMIHAALTIRTRPLAFSAPLNWVGTVPELILLRTAENRLSCPFIYWLNVTVCIGVVSKFVQSMIAAWFVFMIVWSPHVALSTPDDLIRSAGSRASTAGTQTFQMEEKTKK